MYSGPKGEAIPCIGTFILWDLVHDRTHSESPGGAIWCAAEGIGLPIG